MNKIILLLLAIIVSINAKSESDEMNYLWKIYSEICDMQETFSAQNDTIDFILMSISLLEEMKVDNLQKIAEDKAFLLEQRSGNQEKIDALEPEKIRVIIFLIEVFSKQNPEKAIPPIILAGRSSPANFYSTPLVLCRLEPFAP